MSYPYGNLTQTPTLPDLPYTILQRRQGDVKATLIPITINGFPVVIAGWTFTFSVTTPIGVQNVVWTVQAPSSGVPITTIAVNFTIPAFNANTTVTFTSTAQIAAGNQLFIDNAGIFSVTSVIGSTAVLTNTGLFGNLSSGTVTAGTNVYQVGQVGKTILVIPSTITDEPVGNYPFYIKYDTNDPFPGPYKNTFCMGSLNILSQNNPNA